MAYHLYTKRHLLTGLKYFGYTEKAPDPIKYSGSGAYWKKHLKIHGKQHVITDDLWTFDNQEECKLFAERFSIENDIVNSSLWANCIPETGAETGSGMKGKSQSDYQKKRVSETQKGRLRTQREINLGKESRSKTYSKLGYMHPNRGIKRSQATIELISKNHADMTGQNNPMHGKQHSEKSKELLSIAAKNRKKITCEHCLTSIDASNYHRWHGDKCKSKCCTLIRTMI
jgi:hypothetical protein